jgi:hypothetical protein
VGRALVWLGLLLALRPYRNQGVQRFSVASAAFRVIILCLSIAFVPAGVTSSAEHARIVGAVVAWMHVVWCVLLALLCLTKLWGTCRDEHASWDHASMSTDVVKVRGVG